MASKPKVRQTHRQSAKDIYASIQNLDLFEEWWEFYIASAKTLDARPGSKAVAGTIWTALERRGVDLQKVMEGTRLDIDRRIKNKIMFLPHGSNFLNKEYWRAALKVQDLGIVTELDLPKPPSFRKSRLSNQGIDAPLSWKNMNFRSEIEVFVAEALEQSGVLFFPNAKCRFGDIEINKEVDFLVCLDGKWGILEVDGSTHKGCAADDHSRDRMFMRHGIKLIQRYTAEECRIDAKAVVDEFLGFLQRI